MRLLFLLVASSALASQQHHLSQPCAVDAPPSLARPPSHPRPHPRSSLLARASCPIGYMTCDTSFCISQLSTCCGSGGGASCPSGYTCAGSSGCCADGDACAINAAPAGCASGDRVMCGELCIPAGAVCCEDDGSYCYAGQTCNSDGGCDGTATGLGAGPTLVFGEIGDGGGGATATATATAGEEGDGDGAAVGVRANLALVGLVGVMMLMM